MASEPRRFSIQHIFHAETLAHRDRVIADGGVIPDLYMLNQVVDILKSRGWNYVVFGYDSEIFGYKAGIGEGVQKLYSITGAQTDLIQNSIANQPLLVKKSPLVPRNMIEGDGDGFFMKTEALTINGPITIYSTIHCLDLDVAAGIYSGHGVNAPGLIINAEGKLSQFSEATFNELTPSEKMDLFIHRFEMGNFSARANQSPALLNSHSSTPEWSGFTLFAKGDNSATSRARLGTLIASTETSAEEQSGFIQQIFNLSYGQIFN